MSELVKSYELAKRFDVPKPTMFNWSKAEEGTWRHTFYKHLVKVYVKELAEQAKEL